jgi:exopolysaccharide biosynthesis polyprenyl glycosylphosphotransferase
MGEPGLEGPQAFDVAGGSAASLIAAIGASGDSRTVEALERRQRAEAPHRRGWLVRRMLLLADVVSLVTSFLVIELVFGTGWGSGDSATGTTEYLLLAATIPGWIVIAKLYRLYDNDEERTHHGTTDDFLGIFHLVTVGVWLLYALSWATQVAHPSLSKMVAFWGLTIVLVTTARTIARGICRNTITYLQNAVIVGAGDVGQQVARKLLRHPEYGINVIGFVDAQPLPRQDGLEHIVLLGDAAALPELVKLMDVERVIIAFSNDSPVETLEIVRSLNDADVQIDVVPRLFELVSPSVRIDTVEGLPLIELPPRRISRSSRLVKRAVDIVGATIGLILTAPLFVYFAWRIKRDSPGPVFFRQTRLGQDRREFTALKFRTMRVGVDTTSHREYIKRSMDPQFARSNGLFKLEAADKITPFGRFLRRTSLDELPQLINVLRGDMSLVGPRPCIGYETEHFLPHHFDRFLVPAGITGLWQVTARAHATFREALDMDVAYARGWSLGLDLRLLCRTPLEAFARKATT